MSMVSLSIDSSPPSLIIPPLKKRELKYRMKTVITRSQIRRWVKQNLYESQTDFPNT